MMRMVPLLLVVAVEASSRFEATVKIRKDAGKPFGPQEPPHPAMHGTALALGAAEQHKTCNAVLIDGATYVCYAPRVPCTPSLQPTLETIPARCLRRVVARTLFSPTVLPVRMSPSGIPQAPHPTTASRSPPFPLACNISL